MAVTIIFLIAATWPLWRTPRDFPAVPLFAFAIDAPRGLDGIALAGLCCALVLVLVSVLTLGQSGTADAKSHDSSLTWATSRVAGWIVFLVAALCLVVLDQHRLQPWLWQAILLSMLFSTQDARSTLHGARLIVIAIYAYSAGSKFDASFLQSHGPALVDGLLANVNQSLPLDRTVRAMCAALLPAGELLAAGLLAFDRSRRVGLWVSAAMHLGLMAALGPGGLHHKPGVLIWNVFFLAQNALLFSRRADASSKNGVAGSDDAAPMAESARDSKATVRVTGKRAAFASIMTLAGILPAAEWLDRLDPWLGWSVYASRPPRMQLYVDEQSVERLPDDVQPFIAPPAPLERWRHVRIDRWSLAATSAPISPHIRFQLGVAIDLSQAANLHQDDMKVVVESSADRRTGHRSVRELIGIDALREFAATCRFNALPRTAPHGD